MNKAIVAVSRHSSRIFRSDRHSAVILLASAVLGLVLANTAIGPLLIDLNHTELPTEGIGFTLSIGHWIADLLLAFFFFIVAAELKYELTQGQLNTVRKALVPTIAAVGGVAVPALIYLLLSGGGELTRGWPVPTATDIAFALGVLAIFGRGLPTRLRVFLLALAVLDDLMGILFIATLFTSDLNAAALGGAAVSVAAFALLSRVRSQVLWLPRAGMVVLAIATWYLVMQSGIHPTIAGVALGLAIVGNQGTSLAHHFLPWSNSVVLPLFAFSASLVALPAPGTTGPVLLALTLALPLGKTIGITLGALVGARVARAHLTHPIVGWDLIALAVTGGLGFTVALLMNQLAFRSMPDELDQGVLGVLAGSGISLVIGAALIAWRARVHLRISADLSAEELIEEMDEDEDGEPDTAPPPADTFAVDPR